MFNNMAQDYAETIRDELATWELIHDAWISADQDPEEAAEILIDPELIATLDEVGGWEEVENHGTVSSLYTEANALDAWVTVQRRYDGSENVENVTILRTAGGPHCEIIASMNGGRAEIVTCWGGDTGRAFIMSRMIDEAAELALECIDTGVQA
jgi:hypothetical protein